MSSCRQGLGPQMGRNSRKGPDLCTEMELGGIRNFFEPGSGEGELVWPHPSLEDSNGLLCCDRKSNVPAGPPSPGDPSPTIPDHSLSFLPLCPPAQDGQRLEAPQSSLPAHRKLRQASKGSFVSADSDWSPRSR